MSTTDPFAIDSIEIQWQELGRCFSGNWAIRHLAGSIQPGSVTAILGANGAGKSTFLRLLAGQMPVTEGEIRFDGRRLRQGSIPLRRKAMLLGEIDQRQIRATDFIASLLIDYHRIDIEYQNRVLQWVDRLGILNQSDKALHEMSRGGRFKIALAALFAIAPPIWLLDEPMSAGLDAAGMRVLEEAMERHAKSGGTVVFSSQWPQHAVRLADQAVVLHEGHLVWQGQIGQALPDPREAEQDESLRAVLEGLSPADHAAGQGS